MWPFGHKNTEQELQTAQGYVEQNRYSGLTRHYDIRGIQDCIADTGVKVTKKEAKDIVNAVRQQNGWPEADYL